MTNTVPNPTELRFLETMYAAAKEANHKWPAAAACEAVVETGWGVYMPWTSHNVLGIKAFRGWQGPVVSANGTEQAPDGGWTQPQPDKWCVFPGYADCFREQMKILQEPRYALAMQADTLTHYVIEESRVWSTGILKGTNVLMVYEAHKGLLQG